MNTSNAKRIAWTVIKYTIIFIFSFVILINLGVVIANLFFDNAASIDACQDSGGAWSYVKEKCVHEVIELDVTEQVKYIQDCETTDGKWDTKSGKCIK